MKKLVKKRSKKFGLDLDVIREAGHTPMDTPVIRVMRYDSTNVTETDITSPAQCAALRRPGSVAW